MRKDIAMADVYWYLAKGDGTADVYPDSKELHTRIDALIPGEQWFISPEGAIRHGGLIATAFEYSTEPLFDSKHWFETGERKYAGERSVLKITEAVYVDA
jgi:hypothetical protein